jgi:hypothetical protein
VDQIDADGPERLCCRCLFIQQPDVNDDLRWIFVQLRLKADAEPAMTLFLPLKLRVATVFAKTKNIDLSPRVLSRR